MSRQLLTDIFNHDMAQKLRNEISDAENKATQEFAERLLKYIVDRQLTYSGEIKITDTRNSIVLLELKNLLHQEMQRKW